MAASPLTYLTVSGDGNIVVTDVVITSLSLK